MPAKPETFERWFRRRISQANSRCKRLGVEGRLDPLYWAASLRGGKFRCWHCADYIEEPRRLSLDHVIPISNGGKNTCDNVVVTHRACNLLRSDWEWAQWIKFVALLRDNGFWNEFKRRFKPRRFRR